MNRSNSERSTVVPIINKFIANGLVMHIGAACGLLAGIFASFYILMAEK